MNNYIKTYRIFDSFNVNEGLKLTHYINIADICNIDKYEKFYSVAYINKDNHYIGSEKIDSRYHTDEICYKGHIYKTRQDMEKLKCIIDYEKTLNAIDNL